VNSWQRWTETATRDYYNNIIKLPWRTPNGDYDKSNQLGSVQVPAFTQQTVVSIPLKGGFNDFYVSGGGAAPASYYSREAAANLRPRLIVNGSKVYTPTRDTTIDPSTYRPLGTDQNIASNTGILIAFDDYTPSANDTLTLQLTGSRSYSANTLKVYPTAIYPGQVRSSDRSDSTIVADFRAKDFATAPQRLNPTQSISGDTVTGYWEGNGLTAFDQAFKIPPGDDYYLTTVMKLDSNWAGETVSMNGGKLPGLSNTGIAEPGSTLMAGKVDCSDTGWGGRQPNGCRWSARTHWEGRDGNSVGIGTYYYALAPHSDLWGETEQMQKPLPVGQWFAYVEHVKVNDIGKNNGVLSYWLCDNQGCTQTYTRNDIQYRSVDLPQSKINEVWADVYCGGTRCYTSKNPTGAWPRSTSYIKRLTVTRGLPSLDAIPGELRSLNAGK
jgi:hypothetical protein